MPRTPRDIQLVPYLHTGKIASRDLNYLLPDYEKKSPSSRKREGAVRKHYKIYSYLQVKCILFS